MLFAKQNIGQKNIVAQTNKDHERPWKNHKGRMSKLLLAVQQVVSFECFQSYPKALPAEKSFRQKAITSSTISTAED